MDRNPAPWWIGILAAVAALLLVLQPAAGRQAEELVGSLLAPVALQLSGATASVSGFWNTVQSIGSLQSTASQQKEEIERLNFELVRMRELELENEDLRRLNGFRYGRPKMELLPVRMLGTDSIGIVSTIIVDKGSEDGLTEDMAVITWQGLAGRVIEVKSHTASVLLLSDVSSSVAAKVQNPESRARGVVSGRKEGGLVMKHILQQETVQPGDLVITAGVGGLLPEGLPIGRVVRVDKRNIEMFQEAILEQAVDPNRLERLYAVLDYPRND